MYHHFLFSLHINHKLKGKTFADLIGSGLSDRVLQWLEIATDIVKMEYRYSYTWFAGGGRVPVRHLFKLYVGEKLNIVLHAQDLGVPGERFACMVCEKSMFW
jgi:hypothetical protein